MKKLVSAIVVLTVIVIFFGCKDEVIDSQVFVNERLLGRWPLKYRITTVYTNNIAAAPDTVNYNPVDTLIFTSDGMATTRNKTVISSSPYSVDARGENITFNQTPPLTLQIRFIRYSSIGFGTETTTKNGANEIRTVIEDHYLRQ